MSREFSEIMEALRDLAVDQSALKERVEAHLAQTKEIKEKVSELDQDSKLVHRHDIFMKASLWVYGLLITTFGVNFIKH